MHPEYVKRLIANETTEVPITGAAWVKHQKGGRPEQIYRARYEPQMDGGGQVVAAEPLRSFGMRNLASVQRHNNDRRLAAQALLDLNVNYDKNKAADKYARINQLLGKEVHHMTEIDTFVRALSSASPEAQIKGVAALLNDGFTFSDHPRNQIALWGDIANVPGVRTKAGERVIPANHPGKGEHQTDGGVHQRVDEINRLFNLPNTNEAESLERYMQSLTPDEQVAYIKVLGQIHRKGIQDVKNLGNSAKKRTTGKLEEALSDLYMSKLRRNAEGMSFKGRDISDSQGQIVGEKPLVINADEGSQVFVHTNGNGNGKNGHAKTQKAFNELAEKK